MNNSNPALLSLSFKQCFAAMGSASKTLLNNFILALLLSAGILLVIGSGVGILILVKGSSYFRILIAAFLLSFTLPLIQTSLAELYQHTITNAQPKLMQLWRATLSRRNLNLIVIYLLIIMSIILASKLVIIQWPQLQILINNLRAAIVLILEGIISIAIPLTITHNLNLRPLPTLYLASRACLRNLKSCLVLLIINCGSLVAIIILSTLIARLANTFLALGIYVILLWLLLTWFGLSCAAIAKNMLSANKPLTNSD